MNKKYDRLARYQYDNPEARLLIDEYMNDEEIEYIIEYAIDPTTFIDYVKAPSFSVYHVEFYDLVSQYLSNYSKVDIVEYAEKISQYSKNPQEDLKYLIYYTPEELIYYLEKGDEYGHGQLVLNPDSNSVILGEDYTISTHTPKNLVTLEEVLVKDVVFNAYQNLIKDINDKYHVSNGGNMTVIRGYLSYEDLVNLRQYDESILPGHDFVQTGLHMQINLENSIFKNNTRKDELVNLLCKNSFIFENIRDNILSIRYNIDYACQIK